MASRYWVGGTADWDGTAGTKWATTSGGAGGASKPGLTDAVFFDANSGSGTTTVTTTAQCASLTCTGYTGTLAASPTTTQITVNTGGNVVFSSSMTVTGGRYSMNGGTITSAGKSVYEWNANAGMTPADDLSATDIISVGAGINFDASNFNISTRYFQKSGTGTITMGSGTWTLTGDDGGGGSCWSMSGTATVTANTSTVKFTSSSANVKTFSGAGKTYNNIWFSGGGTGSLNVTGANTFNNIKVDTGQTIKFTAGTTTTFTSATLASSVTISSITSAVHTLSCASGSVVAIRGTVSYSTATGGASFKVIAGTDGGNNTGWVFLARMASGLMFASII